MALGIVTEEQFKIEQERLSNKVQINTGIVKDVNGIGRPNGKPNIPDGIKKLAAEALINGSNHKDITEALMISQPVTNASVRGMSSSNTGQNTEDKDLKKFVDEKKEHVKERAYKKIHLALGQLTKEKISGAKARDIAGIAKDMASVVQMMEPEKEEKNDKGTQNNFVFMVPPMNKSVTDYEVIDVVE